MRYIYYNQTIPSLPIFKLVFKTMFSVYHDTAVTSYFWLLQNGQTGLMLAAKCGHEEVVKFLISKGVNVLQKDNVSDIMTCLLHNFVSIQY